MLKTENPAGRLHTILLSLKSKDHNAVMYTVWANALGIEKQNEVEILNQVCEVYKLADEIENLIKINSSTNHDLYLASHDVLRKIVSPVNLNGRWHQIKDLMNSDVLTRLQFCSEELSKFYEEEKISHDEIQKITDITNLLFEELSSSNVDEMTKLLLLEEIERIRRSLVSYRIKGAKGVKEALQATLGAVIVNQEQLKVVAKNSPDVLKRLGDLLDKLDSFTSKALKLHNVLTKPVKFFLSFIDEDAAP